MTDIEIGAMYKWNSSWGSVFIYTDPSGDKQFMRVPCDIYVIVDMELHYVKVLMSGHVGWFETWLVADRSKRIV